MIRRILPFGSLVFTAALATGCLSKPEPIEQPIAFNHALHVGKAKIPCTDCHAGAEKAPHAGLPAISQCLLCHMKPQGDRKEPSEKEMEVRRKAAEGSQLHWTQVTRNPGHVYFSHRAHTAGAGLTCETCHGDVALWEAPPQEPNTKLMDMLVCMDCHRKQGAANGCRVCHH